MFNGYRTVKRSLYREYITVTVDISACKCFFFGKFPLLRILERADKRGLLWLTKLSMVVKVIYTEDHIKRTFPLTMAV